MPTTPAVDGRPLAYQIREGDGPTLIFSNGIATVDSYWRPLLDHLQGRARLVTWDLPGHGASAPASREDATSLAALADNLFRVADAAGATGPVVLLGFSMGCQVVLEAWRRHADRIAGLITAFGSFGRPFDTLIHPRVGPLAYKVVGGFGPRRHRLMFRAGWAASHLPFFHPLNQLTRMVGPNTTRAQMRPFYDHMGQLDPQTWTWMLRHAQAHSTEDLLPDITVPTLVFAGGRDLFTPPDRGRIIAQRVPGARLVEYPTATHTGLLDEASAVAAEVDAFLAGLR